MGIESLGDESVRVADGWLDLTGSAWILRADPTTSAWSAVPEAVRTSLAFGIPGTVPGCVHTDLMAAGLLADPYFSTNEADQVWVGQQTWSYSFTLDLDGESEELYADNCDLVCEGLDTIAEIRVNGRTMGTSANMHRRNVFPIRPNIGVGPNLIEIIFLPALEYTTQMAELVGERIHVEKHPFNLIRKMACNFGWDWGPSLVTAGIWKPIGLRSWDHARITDVGVFATATENEAGDWQGNLRVDVQIQGETRFGAVTVRVRGNGASSEAVVIAEDWTQVELTLTDIQPWWPHSLGEQPLYDVEVVFHNDVRILDTVHKRTGFRTVELDTTPDADGKGANFGFVINGVAVFARGMDWIPDDCKDIISEQMIKRRVKKLGDEITAAYPEEEPFALEIEAEARDNVIRLSAYPSLILWNGNNENLWGHEDWGWEAQLQGRTWGADYYYRLFPEIVAELDPSRPYWPGSPSSGPKDLYPNDPNYGCIHIWDVWNARDYTCYDDYSPRFVAEFGYQGPATYATWARALAPEDRSAASAAMLMHQKAAGGNTKLNDGINGHLPAPGETKADFDEWLFAMQVQQARAVRYGIERWRSLRGRCLGSVIWQLNDCWPVTSWAALDLGTNAAGEPVARRKPLWYAVRSAYADHLITVQHDEAGWRAVLVNDGTDTWAATGTIEVRALDGEVLYSEALDETLAPRSRKDLPLTDLPALDRTDVAIVVTAKGAERAVKLLVEDVDTALPEPLFETTVARTTDGVSVSVTARSFLRSLCLFPDRVSEDAWVDNLLVDLFPGDTHTFIVAGEIPEDAYPDLTSRPVLRSVTKPLTLSEAT